MADELALEAATTTVSGFRQAVQDFFAPQLREIGARLDALDKRLDTGLETADKRASSGLEAINRRLDGMDRRFDRLEASLNLFAHVQSIEACLSRIEGRSEQPSA